MSSVIDNLIAFRILYMLVTPFEQTDAFELGIIDKSGNALKKIKDLKSIKEKESYTALHRLVFNLKKLLAKLPGGASKITSIIAAYWLIKENIDKRYIVSENQLNQVIELIETKNLCLVEEEIEISKFLNSLDEDGGVIANAIGVTGAAISLDQALVKKKQKIFKRKDLKNV